MAARERVNASLQTSYGGDASTKTSEDRGDYIPGIEYSINEQEDCLKDTSKWRETKCKIEERTKQCLSEHGDVDLGELLKRGSPQHSRECHGFTHSLIVTHFIFVPDVSKGYESPNELPL